MYDNVTIGMVNFYILGALLVIAVTVAAISFMVGNDKQSK